MKYIKLFMILAVALPFFTSCSEDDDVNTAQCTVGFQDTEIRISEATAGYTQIPITVSGKRNGQIHLTIESAPAGENPAVEGEHYRITDKTLNLNADTLSTGVINVEVQFIDDDEINAARQFTLTITSADGAEVENAQTTVIITDNESNPYSAFAGSWTLNATSLKDGTQVSIPVSITAAAEGEADFEKVLKANGNYSGIELAWNFSFSCDQTTGEGVTSFVCGEQIGEYSGYPLVWYIYTGDGYLYEGELPAEWTLTDEGRIPTSITFDPNYGMWLYAEGGGYLVILGNMTLTRN